jgi:hypothetical protein
MHIIKILPVLVLLLATVQAVRPPAPLCRSVPLPPLIPISVGEERRIDLQNVFAGS